MIISQVLFRSYLNSLVFFPSFFNFAIWSSWSEPQSAPGFVFAHCNQLLRLWLQKKVIKSDFGIDDLKTSMCRVFSDGVGRTCLLGPVHYLGRILLAFSWFHSLLQGQTCLLLQVCLDFLLLRSSPLWWKGYLFWLWSSVGFDYRIFTGLEEIKTLGGHKQNFIYTRTQGKRAVTQNRHPQTDPAQSEGLLWRHVLIGPDGTGHWQQQSWEAYRGIGPFGGHL